MYTRHMLILTLRTDSPEAEIGLYDGIEQVSYETWHAHRQLAETLHLKIKQVLEQSQKQLNGLEGIVIFQGPGSFTGLRIGVSIANALAYGQNITVVGAGAEQWISQGIQRLISGQNDLPVLPEYGALPHITAQKK